MPVALFLQGGNLLFELCAGELIPGRFLGIRGFQRLKVFSDAGVGVGEEFLEFAGIDAKALKKQLAAGKGDGEILNWVKTSAKPRRTEAEIEIWSAWQERRTPDNPDAREFFNNLHKEVAPKRTDITSWFDLLDVDDFASYGGKV